MSLVEMLVTIRTEFLKFEILSYTIFIIGGLISISTYTIMKTSIPYFFWRHDKEFIKALMYEKKEDSLSSYAVVGIILLGIISFFLLISFWTYIFIIFGGRTLR